MINQDIIKKINSSYRTYIKKNRQTGGENFIVSTNDLYELSDLDYDKQYSYAPTGKLQTAPYSSFGN